MGSPFSVGPAQIRIPPSPAAPWRELTDTRPGVPDAAQTHTWLCHAPICVLQNGHYPLRVKNVHHAGQIRLPTDLGQAIRQERKRAKLKATDIAAHSGRSRDVLYRLEKGDDITVASLLDILRAMNLGLRLEPLGMPTLEEVQRRFAQDDEDDDDAPGGAAMLPDKSASSMQTSAPPSPPSPCSCSPSPHQAPRGRRPGAGNPAPLHRACWNCRGG